MVVNREERFMDEVDNKYFFGFILKQSEEHLAQVVASTEKFLKIIPHMLKQSKQIPTFFIA